MFKGRSSISAVLTNSKNINLIVGLCLTTCFNSTYARQQNGDCVLNEDWTCQAIPETSISSDLLVVAEAKTSEKPAKKKTDSAKSKKESASKEQTVAEPELTRIQADGMEHDRKSNITTFTGGVKVDQGDRHVEADHLRYDQNNNLIDATGNCVIEQTGLRLTGSKATFNLTNDTGKIEDLEYFLTETKGRGDASKAEILSKTTSRYRDLTYTTCEAGRDDWILSAKKMKINQETGIGLANNVTLRFKGVPFIYTPYMSFPIDDRRKSGFLSPTIGNSVETGTDILIPYYINIAPNMDATVTPRIMTKRGLLVGGEFRFLTQKQSGLLRGEIIPSDDEYATDPGSMRGAFSLQHKSRLKPRWSTNILYNYASDNDYMEDFGGNLGITSTRNLERRGDLIYSGQEWRLLTRVQGFQTIDDGIADEDIPYDRLPQLLLTHHRPEQLNQINWDLDAEYTYFSHSTKEYGSRLALSPSINYPMRAIYGHLIPEFRVHNVNYSLQNRAAGLPGSDSLTTTTFSIDSGLSFERDINWLGDSSIQTLEPRLFYLYSPEKNQDDLPDFDSEELDFSFSNLFRFNRFTGKDRVGDANQLTVGLTSRTLSRDSGHELFRLSVGQIFYFDDRNVQLEGDAEKDDSSPIALEAAARINDQWQARAGWQWNPHRGSNKTEKSSIELHYQTKKDQILNLAYRFRRDEEEDMDLSFRWPFSEKLEFVGRVNYSLLHGRTMESFAGLEYRRCCWAVRAVTRHYLNDPNGKADTAIMLQLELTGLGSLGERVDQFLERGIYGYKID